MYLRFDAAIQEHVFGDGVHHLVQTVVAIRVDDMDALLRGAIHLAVPVPLQFLRSLQSLPREGRGPQPIVVVLPADEMANGAAEAGERRPHRCGAARARFELSESV